MSVVLPPGFIPAVPSVAKPTPPSSRRTSWSRLGSNSSTRRSSAAQTAAVPYSPYRLLQPDTGCTAISSSRLCGCTAERSCRWSCSSGMAVKKCEMQFWNNFCGGGGGERKEGSRDPWELGEEKGHDEGRRSIGGGRNGRIGSLANDLVPTPEVGKTEETALLGADSYDASLNLHKGFRNYMYMTGYMEVLDVVRGLDAARRLKLRMTNSRFRFTTSRIGRLFSEVGAVPRSGSCAGCGVRLHCKNLEETCFRCEMIQVEEYCNDAENETSSVLWKLGRISEDFERLQQQACGKEEKGRQGGHCTETAPPTADGPIDLFTVSVCLAAVHLVSAELRLSLTKMTFEGLRLFLNLVLQSGMMDQERRALREQWNKTVEDDEQAEGERKDAGTQAAEIDGQLFLLRESDTRVRKKISLLEKILSEIDTNYVSFIRFVCHCFKLHTCLHGLISIIPPCAIGALTPNQQNLLSKVAAGLTPLVASASHQSLYQGGMGCQPTAIFVSQAGEAVAAVMDAVERVREIDQLETDDIAVSLRPLLSYESFSSFSSMTSISSNEAHCASFSSAPPLFSTALLLHTGEGPLFRATINLGNDGATFEPGLDKRGDMCLFKWFLFMGRLLSSYHGIVFRRGPLLRKCWTLCYGIRETLTEA
eukprot:GHVS01033414.1.p1 GENE.GHVS01033414.1~~GHVS01033414.1.p1  ORF type:complete len:648 (-),score=95.37 GHVS01033414.1:287-2230(-)